MRKSGNKSGKLFGIVLSFFAVAGLFWTLPFISHAKEPVTEIKANYYLGYLRDGRTWPEEYEAKTAEFLSTVDDEWTVEQKIVYLHDYLVTNTDYDFSFSTEGQYGLLVNNLGICEDFTTTFSELAGRMGINALYVGSDAMNHAWNLVEIDGEWYYLDCTWDDNTTPEKNPRFKMYCDHEYLLKSDSAFRHGKDDWKTRDGKALKGLYNAETYDNACWNDSLSPLVIYKDGFLVLKRDGEIYYCDSKGANSVLIASVENPFLYGTMVSKDDYVFVSNSDTIYSLDTDSGVLVSVYNLTDEEKSDEQKIYGIEIEGTKIRYDLAVGDGKPDYKSSGYLDLETVIGKEIKGFSLNESALTFYDYDTTYQLELSDYNENIVSADSWISSNPEVASVDSSGLVTAVGYGKTVISAIKDGKKYRCTVAFDSTWQNDYRYGIWEDAYSLSEYIYIDRYIGDLNDANIVIPSSAYVEGNCYKTSLRGGVFEGSPTSRYSTFEPIYPDNDVIESISLENGVSFADSAYCMFYTCKNLKRFDFGGSDISGTAHFESFFSNTKSLEAVDLSGSRIDVAGDTLNLLNRATGIKEITAPDYIKDGLSIPIISMRIQYADGSYGTEIITDLAEVPMGAKAVSLEDTTWQNEFEHRISGVSGYSGYYLILDKYIGHQENIYIPATAIEDGHEYPVCIRGAAERSDGALIYSPIFGYSVDMIKTFKTEEGVIVYPYIANLFDGQRALKEVDFEGCDLSKTTNLDNMFRYAYQIEKVSFKGCNLNSLTSANNFFIGCNSLKEIVTPDVIKEGISIPLPCPMYEKNEDGTTKDEAYTTLEDAPRGCVLTSEKTEPHNLKHVEAKEAKCTENGHVEYWYCEDCDRYFFDENAKEEIAKEGMNSYNYFLIHFTGHKWDEGVIIKEVSETENGECLFTCQRCGKTKTETISRVIKFGKYEQDGDLTNGKEDIEWEVLSQEGNRLYVISKYVLDNQPYNSGGGEATWETSSLREWLNNDFFKSAFTEEEQAMISSVTLINNDNPYYNTDGGNDTVDKVFILSTDELLNIYGDKEIFELSNNISNPKMNVAATKYAKTESTCWWIRTPGAAQSSACDVIGEGKSGYWVPGNHIGVGGSVGIRPAMYIELAETEEHNLNHIKAKEATCDEDGNKEYWYCKDCNKYYSDENAENEIEKDSLVIEATGHKWDKGYVTKEATEEAEGVMTYTCEKCHETYTEVIPKKEHEHSLKHVNAKAATCTEAGNSEYWYCSKCGKYFSDENCQTEIEKDSYVISAIGHKWDNGVVTKEATETAEGEKTFTCSVCGEKRTESIPKLEPKIEDPVKAFVTRFYTIILQRDTINDEEIEYYTSRLLSHKIDGCTVARGFVMSPEYTGKGEDNLTFVNKMYAAFFNREADDAAFYVNLLEAGHSREVVLAGFVNSPEFKNLCAEYGINPGELVVEPENNNPENNQGNGGNNQGNNPSDDVTKLNLDTTNVDPEKLDEYVKNLYLKILGRDYDEGGLQYWKEQIMAGTMYDAATAARVGFFESPEYQEKNKSNKDFVIDCYHAFLGRDPEPDGLTYWTEKLDSGEYSKQKVIDLGFGHSEEFKNILRDCGFRIIE